MNAPALRTFTLRIVTGDDDLPEDRFSDHVNNARYFAFVNRTFQGWYRAMGLRGGLPHFTAVMARIEWDFVHEVRPPAIVECRIEVERVGRTSLEHSVAIHDLGVDGDAEPRLAGRGRVVHVGVDRATRRSSPWPAELLALCAPAAGPAPGPAQGTSTTLPN